MLGSHRKSQMVKPQRNTPNRHTFTTTCSQLAIATLPHMYIVLIGVVCLDSRAALSIVPGAWSVSGVTRRKLQTPQAGTAEEHKRQEIPTINPIGPTDTPHRQCTKRYRKDSPGDA